MPGAAVAAGLADQVLPLDQIAARLVQLVVGRDGVEANRELLPVEGNDLIEATPCRILVVEDSRTQALEIQLLLEESGFTVGLAGDGRQALAALRRGLPDVVLTDLDMPEMNGLELVEAVRRDYPAVPVVLMTALGSEEIAVEALQKGAASYVPKRNLRNDIADTLDNVIAVAQAGRDQQRVLDCLTQTELHFVLENDPALAPPLIGLLEEQAARLEVCDRHDLMRVGVALHEALLNAIHHGNLELSSELRQESDEKDYRDLAAVRRGAAALPRPPRPRHGDIVAFGGRLCHRRRRAGVRLLHPAGPRRPGQRRPHRRPRPDAHPHLHGRGAAQRPGQPDHHAQAPAGRTGRGQCLAGTGNRPMARILVVEDSPTQARQLAFILEDAGFEVETAPDAELGFLRLAGGHFDAVLSDLLLPGDSGFDLCRRVKADPRYRGLPVVVLTSQADPSTCSAVSRRAPTAL